MKDQRFETYLTQQAAFREKWRNYLSSPPDFDESHRLDVLTPFFGTPYFEELSNEKKNLLFFNYVRFMAESLIVFEQVLLYCYFVHRQKKDLQLETFSKPFSQFSNEELYHSMAFRHFLSSHRVFHQFPKSLLLDATGVKNIFAVIVRIFPGALYICSPRVEALSLAYYLEIKKAYDGKSNSWLKVHQLHYQDEVFHIPLNYHFHNSFIEKHGPLRTLLGSILFLMMMQVMLMRVCFGAVAQSFPEKSLPGKILWTLRFIKWSMKTAEAYGNARDIMKRNFQSLKPRYSNLFSFLIK